MKKYDHFVILTLAVWLMSCQTGWTQTETPPINQEPVTKPIRLDRAALSGIGLKQIQLKDTPERQFFQKRLYQGKTISVYVVSSESWTVPFDKFWFDEFIYILNGKARVQANGENHYFQSGEYFFAPKGFPGEWEVQAGDHLHYELSVITNQRADSTAVSKYTTPQLLDKTELSGITIALDEHGHYERVLMDGVELLIRLQAEAPRDVVLTTPEKEKLICLLSGQLELTATDGTSELFYSGDYVVIPPGFTGQWISQGHSIIKYITIEKS